MQVLKQSTTATILVGPVLDADGAAYTSAVIGDFNLTKNGNTAALAAAATATHSHNGMYLIALTAGNTDTLGRLDVSMNNTSYGMTNHRYEVLTANQFDALVTNGSVTPAAIADAVWDEATVDHTSTGSFGAGVGYIITTVAAILVGVNQLTSRITTGVATMFGDLITMITGSGTANAKFTTKALEEAGGPDVYVYPMSIEQEPRNTYAKITVYTGETGSQHFFAFDSTNTALDLTGKTLEFRVADSKTKQLLYTAKTSDATLVISLGNKVEFTKSTKFTRFAHTDVTYSLRDMGAGEEVLLEGPVVVRWAP